MDFHRRAHHPASEFAKLAIIIYTASALNRKKEDEDLLKGVLPFL